MNKQQTRGDYDYDVFLSYRHKPLDQTITQKTFNMLESYKLPRSVLNRGCENIKRCFRDTEELAVSRILSDTIENALRHSNCLIVVCSPDTPDSEWVDREVATFIELGRAGRIYPLLIAGDAETSFPPTLKTIPDIMSRVMDVRSDGDDPKAIIAKEELALLRVISRVTGCRESDLLRQHKIRKTRRVASSRLAAVAVTAAVAAASIALWFAAEAYRERAAAEQEASMAMLQSLTYELPSRLVEWQYTGSRIATILTENTEQINEILALSTDRQSVLPEVAANYAKLGTIQNMLGNYREAANAGTQALEIYGELRDDGNIEALSELASAYNNLALTTTSLGETSAVEEYYGQAIALQEEWLKTADDEASRYQMAVFRLNLGSYLIGSGAYADAANELETAFELLSALNDRGFKKEVTLKMEKPLSLAIDLARTSQNLGVCYMQIGNFESGEEWLTKAVEYGEASLNERMNLTHLTVLQRSNSMLANLLTQQAKFDEAAPYYERTIAIQEKLAADSENIEAQEELAILCNNYGLQLNMRGDFEEADGWYGRSTEIRRALFEKNATPDNQAGYARALYNLAENGFKLQDYENSKTAFLQCLEYYEPVAEALGSYHHSEYLARLCFYQLIYERDFQNAMLTGASAVDLQPDSTFCLLNFAYALLFMGLDDAADQVFTTLAERSSGTIVYVEGDFVAFAKAGLISEHMPYVLQLMATAGQ